MCASSCKAMCIFSFFNLQIVVIVISQFLIDPTYLIFTCIDCILQPSNVSSFCLVPVSAGFVSFDVLVDGQPCSLKDHRQPTSDLVQIMPTLDNPALLAKSMTDFTPSSLVARPIPAIANTSSHRSKYLSVLFLLALLISRRPVTRD